MRIWIIAFLGCLSASAAFAQIKLGQPPKPVEQPPSAQTSDGLVPLPKGEAYEALLRRILKPALQDLRGFKPLSDGSAVYIAEFTDATLPRLVVNLSEEPSVLKHEAAAGFYEKGFGTCQPRTELARGTVSGIETAGFKVVCKSAGGAESALYLITRHDSSRTHVIGMATRNEYSEGLRTRGDFVLRDFIVSP